MAKIKKDFLGLYVTAGGWIARPFYGTIFKEGVTVRSHHFGGSTRAGVTVKGETFRRNGNYETWCTTGVMAYEYKDLTKEKIKSKTEWYRDYFWTISPIYITSNEEFKVWYQDKVSV